MFWIRDRRWVLSSVYVHLFGNDCAELGDACPPTTPPKTPTRPPSKPPCDFEPFCSCLGRRTESWEELEARSWPIQHVSYTMLAEEADRLLIAAEDTRYAWTRMIKEWTGLIIAQKMNVSTWKVEVEFCYTTDRESQWTGFDITNHEIHEDARLYSTKLSGTNSVHLKVYLIGWLKWSRNNIALLVRYGLDLVRDMNRLAKSGEAGLHQNLNCNRTVIHDNLQTWRTRCGMRAMSLCFNLICYCDQRHLVLARQGCRKLESFLILIMICLIEVKQMRKAAEIYAEIFSWA